MIRAVFLDAGPLGLLTQRTGKSPEVDECKRWVVALARAGVEVANVGHLSRFMNARVWRDIAA
ncbi:uncharacterized protein SOCE26_105400 [Sorangium cellulosum]|uniref:Uncharacterized protein n=1 Tax=Sorangium cellulosum TaxID=56 RepID=A0A2L0FBM0_SORCE|nr:hypothetical protein [Sorangium cellulosum]AUX48995.1 uncharacterized protein SOCE26_105400 [Sorangium cellulosum]